MYMVKIQIKWSRRTEIFEDSDIILGDHKWPIR